MCLIIDKFENQQLIDKMNRNDGKMTFYKVYKINTLSGDADTGYKVHLQPPFYGELKINHKGEIFSNRKSTSLTKTEVKELSINKGIHVFVNKQEAVSMVRFSVSRIIVEVEANIKDLVQGNNTEAVFTKVTLNKLSLEKTVLDYKGEGQGSIKNKIDNEEEQIRQCEIRMQNELDRIKQARKTINTLKSGKTPSVTLVSSL